MGKSSNQSGAAETAQVDDRATSKLEAVIQLLRRPQGARLDEMMTATGLQAHSVRGAMSGALKKKRGLTIVSAKTEAGRVYRIDDGAGA